MQLIPRCILLRILAHQLVTMVHAVSVEIDSSDQIVLQLSPESDMQVSRTETSVAESYTEKLAKHAGAGVSGPPPTVSTPVDHKVKGATPTPASAPKKSALMRRAGDNSKAKGSSTTSTATTTDNETAKPAEGGTWTGPDT